MFPLSLFRPSLFLLTAQLASHANSHGFLVEPACRGGLNNKLSLTVVDPAAPPWAQDTRIFFPAGDRTPIPNAAMRSQQRAVNFTWEPFEPLRASYRWRAGVCGDTMRTPHHLRGGRFYWPRDAAVPRLVASYRPGGVVDARIRIIGHHHGFMEMHLCDVTKCPRGDISPECFRRGHCVQLKRARNPLCDSGSSRKCGPIDRNFPGRWYLPCSTVNTDAKWEFYGPGTMLFRIPKWFRSKHAVLHWYWAAGNKCNANGVLEYFDGPDRPWGWGQCPGQAEAVGGVSRVQPLCGGMKFPEDYYGCADIAVLDKPINLTATGDASPKTIKKPPEQQSQPVIATQPEKGNGSAQKVPEPQKQQEKKMLSHKEKNHPTQPTQPTQPQHKKSQKEGMEREKKEEQSSQGHNVVQNPKLEKSAHSSPESKAPPNSPKLRHSLSPLKPKPLPTLKKGEPNSTPGNQKRPVPPKPKPVHSPILKKVKKGPWQGPGDSDIRGLYIISLGRLAGRVNSGDVIVGTMLPDLTFQVDTNSSVQRVGFSIKAPGGRTWSTLERWPPFRMFSGRFTQKYWVSVVYDEWLSITVSTPQSWRTFFLKFVQR